MWTEKDNSLQSTFKFKNFAEAFAFMTEVAFAAEKQDHHLIGQTYGILCILN